MNRGDDVPHVTGLEHTIRAAGLAFLVSCGPAWAQPADASKPAPSQGVSADFLAWAATPPMGWNSWDAFGTTITEAQAREQADFMAAHLLPHGFRILTVDIQWYEPGASGHSYRADAPLAMDEWGRLLPAPNRFPSAAGGAGFRPLADYVHAKGLQFGIHLMRGVPRQAVARKLPVKGSVGDGRGHRRHGQRLPVEPGHVRRRHGEAGRAGVLRLGLRADRVLGRRLREGGRHQPAVSRAPSARSRPSGARSTAPAGRSS